jgi:hypothetical protein
MKKIVSVSFACVSVLAASLLLQACSGPGEAPRRADSGSLPEPSRRSSGSNAAATPAAAAAQPATDAHAGHAHAAQGDRIPAYAKTAAELKFLPATLSPQKFVGKTRAAYLAVREIPQTIAQLPCYCHCDVGFGHKSLHTCFVDDHASHCAVCVDEAMLAYALHKEGRLTPEQIRERIVAKYSQPQ